MILSLCKLSNLLISAGNIFQKFLNELAQKLFISSALHSGDLALQNTNTVLPWSDGVDGCLFKPSCPTMAVLGIDNQHFNLMTFIKTDLEVTLVLSRGDSHEQSLIFDWNIIKILSRLRKFVTKPLQLATVGVDEIDIACQSDTIVFAHAFQVCLELRGVLNYALVAEIDLYVARNVKFVLRTFLKHLLPQLV